MSAKQVHTQACSQMDAEADVNKNSICASICQLCSGIFRGQWTEKVFSSETSHFYEELTCLHATDGGATPYRHHSLPQLRASASTGCQLCTILCSQLNDQLVAVDQDNLDRCIAFVSVFEPETQSAGSNSMAQDDTLTLQLTFFLDGQHHDSQFYIPLRASVQLALLHPDLEVSAAQLPTSFPPMPSSQLCQQIKLWAFDCQQQHPKCKLYDPTHRPCRLLDLRSGLRLCDSSQSNDQFATLSHCWGPHLPLRLLRSNLAAFHINIPIDCLPKTFQDAVHFTRSLGIDYLWIDALCIVQDSEEEWIQESVKMADIYSAGVLNIAATSSTDGSGGLYKPKVLSLLTPCMIEATWSGHQAGKYIAVDTNAWSSNIDAAPLNERAWVYQERILSPRTVHFARDQIWWECRQSRACESLAPFLQLDSSDISQLLSDLDINDNDTANESWLHMVTTYTKAKLTSQSDKLIALAGVSEAVRQRMCWTSCEYVAGYWRRNLMIDLLWRADDQPKRSTNAVAPSWSWASIQGEVYFGSTDHRAELRQGQIIELLGIDSTSAEDTAKSSNATLQLRTVLYPVHLQQPEDDCFVQLTLDGVVFDGENFSEAMDDFALYTQDFTGYYCLFTELDGITRSEGLILTVDSDAVYSRVGWMRLFQPLQWKARQTFTLV